MEDYLPFVISGLGLGAVYALSGVGLVVLYRSSGVLEFRVRRHRRARCVCGLVAARADWPQGLAWCAAIVASMLLSLAYGRLLAPRLSHRDPTIRSIATLGFALVVVGFTEWYWGEQPRRLVLPTDAGAIEFVLGEVEVRFTHTRAPGARARGADDGRRGPLAVEDARGPPDARAGERPRPERAAGHPRAGRRHGGLGAQRRLRRRVRAAARQHRAAAGHAADLSGDPGLCRGDHRRLHSLPATVAGGIAIGVLEALAITVPGFAAFRTATPFLIALAMIVFFAPGRGRHERRAGPPQASLHRSAKRGGHPMSASIFNGAALTPDIAAAPPRWPRHRAARASRWP
jgi:branched-chain amino acid transport system permease protein